MTPLETQKSPKKSDAFLRKILEDYSESQIFSQIFFDFGQKQLILHDFSKLK